MIDGWIGRGGWWESEGDADGLAEDVGGGDVDDFVEWGFDKFEPVAVDGARPGDEVVFDEFGGGGHPVETDVVGIGGVVDRVEM